MNEIKQISLNFSQQADWKHLKTETFLNKQKMNTWNSQVPC